MIHFGWTILVGFCAYVFGVMMARNNNSADREYWMQQGKLRDEATLKRLLEYDERYGDAKFVTHGTDRYGKRFMRALDHLEIGGFNGSKEA